jgi:hypothetical protein
MWSWNQWVDIVSRQSPRMLIRPFSQVFRPRGGIVDPQRFAGAAREGRQLLAGRRVDAVVARQLQRPAVVVELAGEEEGVGEAVAFRRVVAVVFVRRDGMQPEPVVGRRVDRQRVVVAHEDWLAIAHHQQLGRQRAVEGPHRLVVLHRHLGVDPDLRAPGRAPVVVQAVGSELAVPVLVQLLRVAQAAVDARARLHRLEVGLRVELVPALVGPALTRRAAFGRGPREVAFQEQLHFRLPRIGQAVVGHAGREGMQAGLLQEGVQLAGLRAAARDAGRVLLRRGTDLRQGEGQGACRFVGVESVGAELLEHQQLLRPGLRAEQGAGVPIGGVVIGTQLLARQHVPGTHLFAGEVLVLLDLHRARIRVGLRGQLADRCQRIGGLFRVAGRIGGRRLTERVQVRCEAGVQAHGADRGSAHGGQDTPASSRGACCPTPPCVFRHCFS